eukprot:g6770.t1
MSVFGKFYSVSTFGESHGHGVGVSVDGVPPLLPLTEQDIQAQLDRRRPGASPSINTARNEADRVSILSGTEFGRTLGTPIGCMVRNLDQRPQDYGGGAGPAGQQVVEEKQITTAGEKSGKEALPMNRVFRPSHADFTYYEKYRTHASSGGGRSSARETIGRVIGGTIADKFLKLACGTDIVAFVSQVGEYRLAEETLQKIVGASQNASTAGENIPLPLTRAAVDRCIIRCPDLELAKAMESHVAQLKTKGDSIGGVCTCVIRNCPVGLGEPAFDRLEALLAHAMLSIPASKGFEIGSGFRCATMRGSQHNDAFYIGPGGEVRTLTNHSGGVQGGISNGENIYFKIAFKPPATISLPQDSVTLGGEAAVLEAKGRHDPFIVNRAIPIVESMAALVLMDLFLQQSARKRAQEVMLQSAKLMPELVPSSGFGVDAGAAAASSAGATAGASAPPQREEVGVEDGKGSSQFAPESRATAASSLGAYVPFGDRSAGDKTPLAPLLRQEKPSCTSDELPPHNLSPFLSYHLQITKYLHPLDVTSDWKVAAISRTQKFHNVLLVTDAIVGNLFREEISKLAAAYARAGTTATTTGTPSKKNFHTLLLPHAEPVKHSVFKTKIEDTMLSHKFGRSDSVLIALGGGVIGDLVGYTASTYMRGIPYVQIPTTLLSMVDSSLGGKVGIDVCGHGKNLVGAFHLPVSTVIDVKTFLNASTFPKKEFVSGMGEILKTALVTPDADLTLWELLKLHTIEDLMADVELLQKVVAETAHTKMVIAGKDPKDDLVAKEKESAAAGAGPANGAGTSTSSTTSFNKSKFDFRARDYPREILNFGHTIGHAVEAESGIPHGLCVSMGMVAEIIDLDHETRLEIENTMHQYSMPTRLPHFLNAENLVKYLKNDKKMGRVVTITAPGKPRIFTPSVEQVRAMMTNERVIRPPPRSSPPTKPVSADADAIVEVEVPASKSITNRAILLAAMCEPSPPTTSSSQSTAGKGAITLENCLFAEDTLLLVRALEQLGVKMAADEKQKTVTVQTVGKGFGCRKLLERTTTGNGGEQVKSKVETPQLYLGNSGTCVRFLSGVLGMVADQDIVIDGVARMKKRPIKPLVDALSPFVDVERRDADLHTFKVALLGGSRKNASISSKEIVVDTSVSSQFLSGLIMALPLLPSGFRIRSVGAEIVSQTFVDMTIACMRTFGVEVVTEKNVDSTTGGTVWHLAEGGHGASVYRAPESGRYLIEPDASAAMYPFTIGLLSNKSVLVPNLFQNSIQGDYKMLQKLALFAPHSVQFNEIAGRGLLMKLLPNTGCFDVYPPSIFPPAALVDLDSSDTTLTFALLAGLAALECSACDDKRETRIVNVDNQNVKECERIRVACDILLQLGIDASYGYGAVEGDGDCGEKVLRIKKNGRDALTACKARVSKAQVITADCYKDHRVAMSVACLAVGLPHNKGNMPSLAVDDYRCVDKTYPGFWDMVQEKFGFKIMDPATYNASWEGDAFALCTEIGEDTSATRGSNRTDGWFVTERAGNYGLPPELLASSTTSTAATLHTAVSRPQRPLFLIGLPGAGKTTLAKELAANFGLPLVETDKEILDSVKTRHSTIATFIEKEGWSAFRAREREVLLSVATTPRSPAAGSWQPQHTPFSKIVDCGGGIVEQNLDILRNLGCCVWVQRPKEIIMKSLEQRENFFIKTADDLEALSAKRSPLYEKAADFIFENKFASNPTSDPTASFAKAKNAFCKWASRCLPLSAQDWNPVLRLLQPLCFRPGSLFACVGSEHDLAKVLLRKGNSATANGNGLSIAPDPSSSRSGSSTQVDFVEVRADLILQMNAGKTSPLDFVSELHANGIFDIIFTLRSVPEGGKFDPKKVTEKATLYREAARRGVSVFDVEVTQDHDLKPGDFLSSSTSSAVGASLTSFATAQKVILSAHSDDFPTVKTALLKKRAEFGSEKVLAYKIVTHSANKSLFEEFTKMELADHLPVILIYKDDPTSRLYNRFLTPVCAGEKPVFPGQLSESQIDEGRTLLNLQQYCAHRFYLVGHPIYKSKSPLWHNWWFRNEGDYGMKTKGDHAGAGDAAGNAMAELKWWSQGEASQGPTPLFEHRLGAVPTSSKHYSLFPTSQIRDVVDLLSRRDTVGISVTMPLKEQVLTHVDFVTEHARKIGATNTVVALKNKDQVVAFLDKASSTLLLVGPFERQSRFLVADNTDWLALRDILLEWLGNSKDGGEFRQKRIIVLATGGTARAACYALSQLELPFYIGARDPAKSAALKADFILFCKGTIVLAAAANGDGATQERFDIAISCLPPEVEIEGTNVEYEEMWDFAYPSKRRGTKVDGMELLARQAVHQNRLFATASELRSSAC